VPHAITDDGVNLHCEFKRMLAGHSAVGSANTQLRSQRERPSLYDLVEQMNALTGASCGFSETPLGKEPA
jgi:hypothetical protein